MLQYFVLSQFYNEKEVFSFEAPTGAQEVTVWVRACVCSSGQNLSEALNLHLLAIDFSVHEIIIVTLRCLTEFRISVKLYS